MSEYNYKSLVSKTEANALKEMIFKRAQEHAEAIEKQEQKAFVDDIHADVMNIAHETFTASKNPFSVITRNEKANSSDNVVNEITAETMQRQEEREIGFPASRRIANVNISESEYNFDNSIVGEVYQVMENARVSLSKNQGFMNALNFLNSQATASLLNKRQNGLEIVV